MPWWHTLHPGVTQDSSESSGLSGYVSLCGEEKSRCVLRVSRQSHESQPYDVDAIAEDRARSKSQEGHTFMIACVTRLLPDRRKQGWAGYLRLRCVPNVGLRKLCLEQGHLDEGGGGGGGGKGGLYS